MDIFKWRTQVQDGLDGSFSKSIREAQFGDGYKQVSEVGINSDIEKWSLGWTNPKSTNSEIFEFLNTHITKSFLWKNPHGETLIYRVVNGSVKSSPLSSKVSKITAEFERVHTV